MQNSGAQIRHQTLDKIVRHAERIRDWQLPLVLRNDLSQRAIRRFASFVSKALIEQLAAKHKLDENTRRYLKDQMKKRIETEDVVRSLHPRGRRTSRPCTRRESSTTPLSKGRSRTGRAQSVVASLALLAGISAETTGANPRFRLGKADRLARLAGGPQHARGLQNPDVAFALAGGRASARARRRALSPDRRPDALASELFRRGRLNEPIVADMGDKSACTLDVGRFKPLAHIAMGFATVAAVDVEVHV